MNRIDTPPPVFRTRLLFDREQREEMRLDNSLGASGLHLELAWLRLIRAVWRELPPWMKRHAE